MQILCASSISAVLFIASLHTTPAFAATVVSGGELKQLLSGKTVRFQGGRRATYNADGSYVFRGGGRTNRGHWRVKGSQVCVSSLNNDLRRCDQYLKDGDDFLLRDANGNRYPVRSIK